MTSAALQRARCRMAMAAAGLGTLALAACSATPPPSSGQPAGSGSPASSPAASPSSSPAGAVPASYQAAYASTAAQLAAFEQMAGSPAVSGTTTIGTELLDANGNIGAGLLAPQAITSVEAELNGFQALGIQGVTVDVSFPLLLPGTPDSSAYLAFYEQVAEQVRNRGMVLSVEENPVFASTPFTALPISYAGLSLATYAAGQGQQAQIIIDDLRPQYLSVLTEPDTFATLLHLDLNDPSGTAQVVGQELSGLSRGTTQVGAGAGTWSSPAIDQALLAQTSIDYLDVHIYPLGPADLANLAADVAAAKAASRPLVMDETWLSKASTSPTAGVSGAPNEQKDVSYSFWEPLDESYVAAMVGYVRSQGFAYVSFFDGARAFFGYLTWTPQLEADSYQGVARQYSQLVSAELAQQVVSATGLRLQQAIAA